MQKLHFQFTTTLDFDSEVQRHNFILKCMPMSNARQSVEDCRLSITPDAEVFYALDSQGNRTANGCIAEAHTSFSFTVEGIVATDLDIFEDFDPDMVKNAYYKYPTKYTAPGLELKKHFAALQLDESAGPYDKALAIMHAVHNTLVYEKDVTDISTSAEEAISLGKGVCQDYAHIMISLCHMAGIPARYVVGVMNGEGETHAWVEALCRGFWYGFDPTNDLLVDGNYIKFSSGRDYSCCVVNKGSFIGGARQTKQIEAVVDAL